jgi:23S rRNA pseudouridine1911/1915/1917 synthase
MVTADEAGERLDVFLARHLPGHSRGTLQVLLEGKLVWVDGKVCKQSRKVRAGESVTAEIPPPPPDVLVAEKLDFQVLYNDADLAVVNKPAGIVVHPGAGRNAGTLASALLHRFGSLSRVGGPFRPGIVHRLDKGTSGALIVALTDVAHLRLVKQFQSREVNKTYIALINGSPAQNSGHIELPVSRDLQRRTRMTTRGRDGRAARTDWRVLRRLGPFTLMEANLHTGRTHQLRVHFSALGHPIVGDALYGAPREPRVGETALSLANRVFLHAARLQFAHPLTAVHMDVRAPLPDELRNFLHSAANALGIDPGEVDATLRPYL